MKARPILFSAPMVRALLNGSKTQTRRIIKGKEIFISASGAVMDMADGHIKEIKFPYGEQGGYLWVRETWAAHWMYDDVAPSAIPSDGESLVHYPADGYVTGHSMGVDHFRKLRPSIFMPRWASRITLRMTGLKVEKLQGISKKDAFAEGVTERKGLYCMDWSPVGKPHPLGGVITESYIANDNPVGAFATYFEKLRGTDIWDLNPLVWVPEFEVIKQNIDLVLKAAA